MHLKRQRIEKFWPVHKRGTKFLAVPTHNQKESIPLIVVLRDILEVVKTKKELKKVINERQIKINQREIRETNYPVCLFDVITLVNAKKNYRAALSEQKKMTFEEVPDKEARTKLFKIIGKKMLSHKKTQLNLMHGKNILSKEKVNTGDSAVVSFKDDKIIRIIPMEKGKTAYVIKGKHAGRKGKIENIIERGGKKLARISSESKRINVWVKNIVAME